MGKKLRGGELGNTNVHLAGADIQEYLVKKKITVFFLVAFANNWLRRVTRIHTMQLSTNSTHILAQGYK
jgi:hypothetical protein